VEKKKRKNRTQWHTLVLNAGNLPSFWIKNTCFSLQRQNVCVKHRCRWCVFAINFKLTLADSERMRSLQAIPSIDKDAPIAAPASTEPLVVRQDILVVLFFVVDEETDKTA
jgi:hypothetical protein